MEKTRTQFLTVPVFVAAMGVSPAILAADVRQPADGTTAQAPDWLKSANQTELTEAA